MSERNYTYDRLDLIRSTLDRDAFKRVCAMREHEFGDAYDLTVHKIDHPAPEDFYFFRDNGSKILAVAHLDTVGLPNERAANFIDTAGGEVVYSRALDDRLGAYIILEWLPAMGIEYDILLTVGEESGMSTASGFYHPDGKRYDWMIEFDRGGTDVVMYQYDDDVTRRAVQTVGARVGDGIFSDICYLEHLGCKGFNWGVGYRDYHGPRAHAYLEDTYMMLDYYLDFHDDNAGFAMPHDAASKDGDEYWWDYGRRSYSASIYEDDELLDPFDTDARVTGGEDYFDREWIENPTPEEMREYEQRMADWESTR